MTEASPQPPETPPLAPPIAAAQEAARPLDPWSKKYREQGKMWGDQPSETGRVVSEMVGPTSRILEVGFGYGRDLRSLLEQGHTLLGVEEAAEGLSMATAELRDYIDMGHLSFFSGDIKYAPLQQGFFDAVFAHRMLHLSKPKSAQTFANRVAGLLRPGGLLVLTARNPYDFNPKQMNRIDATTAIYKDRPDHYVNFWDKDRYTQVFGGLSGRFNIAGFRDLTEMESVNNPVDTHLTMMIAYKRDSSGGGGSSPTGTNGHVTEAPVRTF